MTPLVEIVDEHNCGISCEHFELSATGVYLYSNYDLCPGDAVRMRFFGFGDYGSFDLAGEVVEADPGDAVTWAGFRVAFTSFGQNERAKLAEILTRRVLEYV